MSDEQQQQQQQQGGRGNSSAPPSQTAFKFGEFDRATFFSSPSVPATAAAPVARNPAAAAPSPSSPSVPATVAAPAARNPAEAAQNYFVPQLKKLEREKAELAAQVSAEQQNARNAQSQADHLRHERDALQALTKGDEGEDLYPDIGKKKALARQRLRHQEEMQVKEAEHQTAMVLLKDNLQTDLEAYKETLRKEIEEKSRREADQWSRGAGQNAVTLVQYHQTRTREATDRAEKAEKALQEANTSLERGTTTNTELFNANEALKKELQEVNARSARDTDTELNNANEALKKEQEAHQALVRQHRSTTFELEMAQDAIRRDHISNQTNRQDCERLTTQLGNANEALKREQEAHQALAQQHQATSSELNNASGALRLEQEAHQALVQQHQATSTELNNASGALRLEQEAHQALVQQHQATTTELNNANEALKTERQAHYALVQQHQHATTELNNANEALRLQQEAHRTLAEQNQATAAELTNANATLNREREEYQNMLQQQAAEADQPTKSDEALKKERDEQQDLIKQLEADKKAAHDRFTSQGTEDHNRITDLEHQLSDCHEHGRAMEDEIKQLKNKIDNLEKINIDANNRVSEAEKEYKQLVTERNNLIDTVRKTGEKHGDITNQLVKLRGEKDEQTNYGKHLSKQLQEANEATAAIEKERDDALTAQQSVEEEIDQLKEDYRTDSEALQEQHRHLERELHAGVDALGDKDKELDDGARKIRRLRDEVAELKQKLKDAKAEKEASGLDQPGNRNSANLPENKQSLEDELEGEELGDSPEQGSPEQPPPNFGFSGISMVFTKPTSTTKAPHPPGDVPLPDSPEDPYPPADVPVPDSAASDSSESSGNSLYDEPPKGPLQQIMGFSNITTTVSIKNSPPRQPQAPPQPQPQPQPQPTTTNTTTTFCGPPPTIEGTALQPNQPNRPIRRPRAPRGTRRNSDTGPHTGTREINWNDLSYGVPPFPTGIRPTTTDDGTQTTATPDTVTSATSRRIGERWSWSWLNIIMALLLLLLAIDYATLYPGRALWRRPYTTTAPYTHNAAHIYIPAPLPSSTIYEHVYPAVISGPGPFEGVGTFALRVLQAGMRTTAGVGWDLYRMGSGGRSVMQGRGVFLGFEGLRADLAGGGW